MGPEEGFSSQTGYSDYRFPNHNVAVFAENIFYLGDKVSVTPGVRYEYIRTRADGSYGNVFRDNAGNIIADRRTDEQRTSPRGFVSGGIGVSYKPVEPREVYANISQNYRSITFSDMRIANPSAIIDQNLQDERGYSADLGLRGDQGQWLTYDVSLFALRYNNRIGEVQTYDANERPLRRRGNIGRALILGVESYAEADLLRLLRPTAEPARWRWSVFGNAALIRSRYTYSEETNVQGNDVEFVPALNLKAGTQAGYGPFKASLQLTYLAQQFTDATNADNSQFILQGNAVVVREAAVGPSGEALPRLEFQGEYLKVFVDPERVVSDQPVVLLRGTDRLVADTLDYRSDAGVADFKGRVKVQLVPRASP